MLSLVLDLLSARRWFDTGLPFQTSVHFTQGACVWLLLSRDGAGDTYVKFSEHVSLHDEAARYQAAGASYATLVPAFVGYASAGPIDVLVCRSVDFRSVDASFLFGVKTGAAPVADLLGYFKSMPLATPPATLAGQAAVSNPALIATLDSYYAGHWLAPLAQRWLSSDSAHWLATLQPMAQHGDFVLNNLGRTRSEQWVIFDWEDFGAVSLPGLDLFTFELSLAGGAQSLLAKRALKAPAVQSFVALACAAMGLSVAQYVALTPIYALVFRYLKRNYGPSVREQMDALIQQIDQAGGSGCPAR